MPNIEVTGDRLVAKVTIRGSVEAVWRELTKNNEPQAAVFNAWLHAQSFLPGARLQMRTGDGRNVAGGGQRGRFRSAAALRSHVPLPQYDDPGAR